MLNFHLFKYFCLKVAQLFYDKKIVSTLRDQERYTRVHDFKKEIQAFIDIHVQALHDFKRKTYEFLHFRGRMYTVELQWLEHLWNHENMFETGVVRASEC